MCSYTRRFTVGPNLAYSTIIASILYRPQLCEKDTSLCVKKLLKVTILNLLPKVVIFAAPKVLAFAGGLVVKVLDCEPKGPGFQPHLQQRFISLLGALSPTSKIE